MQSNYNESLENEVIDLISKQIEGDYWDFKQEHHESKAELVHDIICMANNRVDRDCYIIYGIEDGTFNIVGVENNTRRRQSDLVNILKELKFSNGIRPTIELKTIQLRKHTIDILIIKNTSDTPYYLTEDYSDVKKSISKKIVVRANYIYTRVNDTNTDINKNADINHIEYLWKKRFQLNKSPLEQIINKLKIKSEWNNREDEIYNVYNPEISIVFEDFEYNNKTMFYSHAMTNSSTSFQICKIKYFSTILYSCEFVVLDGGRYKTPTPIWGSIEFNKYDRFNNKNVFKYILKDSIEYILNEYFFNENNFEEEIARNNFLNHVLLFEDNKEYRDFVNYIIDNKELYLKRISNEENYIIDSNEKLEIEVDNYQLKVGKVLNGMLSDFRKNFNN